MALAAFRATIREPDRADADPCGAARYTHLVRQTAPPITVSEGQTYRIARDAEPVTMELLQESPYLHDRPEGQALLVSCNRPSTGPPALMTAPCAAGLM